MIRVTTPPYIVFVLSPEYNQKAPRKRDYDEDDCEGDEQQTEARYCASCGVQLSAR